MQVDAIQPKLKAPGTKRLKLKYDNLLSSFAFKFSLRRYTQARAEAEVAAAASAEAASRREARLTEQRGEAVHVTPIKPKSKVHKSKRLKLKHDELLSNFAFEFNLRRYNAARHRATWPPLRRSCNRSVARGARQRQGPTLVHFSAQPEPFLT